MGVGEVGCDDVGHAHIIANRGYPSGEVAIST
jgi:hypothetical protein